MAKNKIDFKRAGARVGGGIVGGAASYGLDVAFPALDPKIMGAIKLGVGAILPELVPEKSKMLKASVNGVGDALIGTGTVQLMQAFIKPAVQGVGNVEEESEYIVDVDPSVNGTENEALSGNENNAMSGGEEEEEESEY